VVLFYQQAWEKRKFDLGSALKKQKIDAVDSPNNMARQLAEKESSLPRGTIYSVRDNIFTLPTAIFLFCTINSALRCSQEMVLFLQCSSRQIKSLEQDSTITARCMMASIIESVLLEKRI
jgi:hypothetical protein